MANDLLNELNRNLANAEEIGNAGWATALKKRIAQLEKSPAAAAPSPSTSTPVVKKSTARKTVKKAVKKTARKKT